MGSRSGSRVIREPGEVATTARTLGAEMLAAGRYQQAREALEQAGTDDPQALVELATVCRILNDTGAATSALESAYRRHLEVGDAAGAAQDAVVLADLALTHLGASSVAKGWLGRARQHLERTGPHPALVDVAGMEAYLALAYDKDPARAREHAEQSVRVAESFSEMPAVLMGNAYLGLIEVSMGELEPGMRLLESSVAAAAAGELEPAQRLDTFCLLLTACERVRDLERVQQWAGRVLSLARQGSDAFAAFARTQYAHALLLGDGWAEADRELDRALRASEAQPLTTAVGLVLQATLRRMQGRLDEADAILTRAEREPYRRAVRHLVISSRAALELARGDAVTAADLAERYLRMVSPSDVIERVEALETLVRARLAQGDPDRAGAAADELAATAALVPTPGVSGSARLARGLLLRARGEIEPALAVLEEAVDTFDRGGLRYFTIEARIALADALAGAGDSAAAGREADLARADAAALGATGLRQSAERICSTLRRPDVAGGLTRRETEVLRLAGSGLANAEIAEELTLSVRTVERHLSNIYLKIGATGPAARAIAIGYGRRHGLE